jgi:photosystem II stability/assembly factor-like uncharacterized protein
MGLVHDATARGSQVWTVEDGGRIRHRDANGAWSSQAVPPEVKDTLRHVTFLEDELHGWAVGQNGWVLGTVDGGAHWDVLHRMPAFEPGPAAYEDLWDVDFLDPSLGWMVGLNWIWCTMDGGHTWDPVVILDAHGAALGTTGVEFYALDVVPGQGFAPDPGWPAQPAGYVLGLATAEPGLVLRTLDGATWQVVFEDEQLCAAGELPSCAQATCTQSGAPYEPWDVDISRHPTQPLALVAGGYDNACGLILASSDHGDSWHSEPHECKCPGRPGCTACAGHPLYTNDPGDPRDLWRLRKMFALYGLAISELDNSAVACGYSGQRLVRDPVHGVWRDRSAFTNDPLAAPQGVTGPLFGAEAAPNGHLYVTGMCGYVFRSADAGEHWTDEGASAPFRIRDACFLDADVGWKVGLYFQISRTADGGRTWTVAEPLPDYVDTFLRAIAFSSASRGVIVGELDPRPGPHQGQPKILFTADGGQTPWREPTVVALQPGAAYGWLSEVAAAGPLEFWAAGGAGLIVRSFDGGETWQQFLPARAGSGDLHDVDFESLSFASPSAGLFVGDRPWASTRRGVAYLYRKSGSQEQWYDVSPADAAVTTLSDVAASASRAYAVGVRQVGAAREGIVLSSTAVGSKFGPFVPMSHPPIPACDAGDDLGRVPVLTEVEIAPDGDVWIAGECGRLWQLVPPSTWIEHKSQTDAHVLGLSVPAADTGFLAGHRIGRTGSAVVGFRP